MEVVEYKPLEVSVAEKFIHAIEVQENSWDNENIRYYTSFREVFLSSLTLEERNCGFGMMLVRFGDITDDIQDICHSIIRNNQDIVNGFDVVTYFSLKEALWKFIGNKKLRINWKDIILSKENATIRLCSDTSKTFDDSIRQVSKAFYKGDKVTATYQDSTLTFVI